MNCIARLSLLMISLLMISCGEGKFEEALLAGKWQVRDWTIEGTGQKRNNKMDMTFNSDRTYSIDYGGMVEEGRCWISNDYLHTVEKGRAEKKVRLIKLVPDTLVFQMNRGGVLENVLLTKS